MEEKIVELYKNIIIRGFYDEKYAGNSQIIDGMQHGVCIDFSNKLIEELRKVNVECGLISTRNDDESKHAAVVYRDPITGEVFIADPVTDVRAISEYQDNERNAVITNIIKRGNYKRNIRDYIKEYGNITAYDDLMNITMDNIQDAEEVEAIPSINSRIAKKVEACQTVFGLNNLKQLADGPTLLACQSLYKKGIDTYCSNYTPNGRCSINVRFNSLSEENKKIIFELVQKYPENYFIQKSTGFYGELGRNDEFDENFPFELVFGFKNTTGKSDSQINLDMNALIKKLKKQEYREGVYTREDILSNKHNLMVAGRSILGLKECNSTIENNNEEIAENEGILYSSKYNLFFKNWQNKSRYIESLYREEHDLRTEKEIAEESEVIFDETSGMFFESEDDMLKYHRENEMTEITPADIAEADIERKITQSSIDKVKQLFKRIIDRLFGKGER